MDQLLVISEIELRQPYSQFLNRVYSFVDPDIYQIIEDLNKMQKGAADHEIDPEVFILSLTRLELERDISQFCLRALFNALLYSVKYEDFAINQVTL